VLVVGIQFLPKARFERGFSDVRHVQHRGDVQLAAAAALEGDAGAWRRRLLVVRYEKPPPAKRVLDFDHVLLRDEAAAFCAGRWLDS